MRWIGVAVGLILGQILIAQYGLTALTYTILGISLVLIFSPNLFGQMHFFYPIKLTNVDIYIDTLPLRQYLSQKQGQPNPIITADLSFILTYGKGFIDNDVVIIPDQNVRDILSPFATFPKSYRLMLLMQSDEPIELAEGKQNKFVIRYVLPLTKTPSADMNNAIEKASQQLENRHFIIKWKMPIGKLQTYKPKKGKVDEL